MDESEYYEAVEKKLRLCCVDRCVTVVQPGRPMSPTTAQRPADLADAALYQGSATAQQHPPIHRGSARTATSLCFTAQA